MIPDILAGFGALFASLLVLNFSSIHIMANLILIEGSSRRKSLSITAEFTLLTFTLLICAAVIRNLLGLEINPDITTMIGAVLALDSILVGIVKTWYIREEYETTYLYAFLIAEGIVIFSTLVLITVLSIF